MTSALPAAAGTGAAVQRPYATVPLRRLVSLIASYGDRQALGELHGQRPVFRLTGGKPMLLGEFADALRVAHVPHKYGANGSDVLDRAYDLTIDKFTNLPETNRGGGARGRTGGGPGAGRVHTVARTVAGTSVPSITRSGNGRGLILTPIRCVLCLTR